VQTADHSSARCHRFIDHDGDGGGEASEDHRVQTLIGEVEHERCREQ
jgi:hypothetical protein